MENRDLVNEKEFQEKYHLLITAIKEADKECTGKGKKFNQVLLSMARKIMEDHYKNYV